MHNYFPSEIRNIIKYAIETISDIEEIRLRCERNIIFITTHMRCYINKNGNPTFSQNDGVKITQNHLKEMVELMSRNSMYIIKNEVKNGFITLKNGCRVGICGKCVMTNDQVDFINNISSLNIRIAREVKNCALDIYNQIRSSLKSILIVSPPGYGKTTLLRDLIRLTSDSGRNISIVDERCELSPMNESKPIFDIGINSDILSGVPKYIGMDMVLRSMNPDIIVTDEIATLEDINAIYKAINSGVKIFATFHGNSKSDFFKKFPGVTENIFDKFIYIKKNKSNIRELIYE